MSETEASVFKPHDKVICIAWRGYTYTVGKMYEIDKVGRITDNNGITRQPLHWYKNHFIIATPLNLALI